MPEGKYTDTDGARIAEKILRISADLNAAFDEGIHAGLELAARLERINIDEPGLSSWRIIVDVSRRL